MSAEAMRGKEFCALFAARVPDSPAAPDGPHRVKLTQAQGFGLAEPA